MPGPSPSALGLGGRPQSALLTTPHPLGERAALHAGRTASEAIAVGAGPGKGRRGSRPGTRDMLFLNRARAAQPQDARCPLGLDRETAGRLHSLAPGEALEGA